MTSLSVHSKSGSKEKSTRSEAIIICTGAEAIWLGAEGEDAQKGRGISTCATCDGAFFREQEVIVIGGGDSAMEEATFPYQIREQSHYYSS